MGAQKKSPLLTSRTKRKVCNQCVHYVDANLHHDLVTARAVTAILHIVNGIPTDWYSKRQATVEIVHMDQNSWQQGLLLTKLSTSGTPLCTKCSNQKQMFHVWRHQICHHNSNIPNSLQSKRHHISAYHRVREAIASKYLMFIWKDSKTNPADILSKHWEFPQIWPLLKPLFSWRGETADIKQQPKGSDDKIPLIVPPVSHKEIRRILGWLLLPLSSSLVPTYSTKKHPSLGAPNGTQVGVYSNNPDVPPYIPHLYIPKLLGPHLNPKWRSIWLWATEQSWIMWTQNYPSCHPT